MHEFGIEAERIMRNASHAWDTSENPTSYGDVVDETVITDSGFDGGLNTEASNEFPDLDLFN